MAGFVLDAGAVILCPHGGRATVTPRTTRVSLRGQPPIVVDDAALVAGCAFAVGGAPSPCTRLQWQLPAQRLRSGGAPVVLSTSSAVCLSAASAPQGIAMVTGFQTRVMAQ